MIQTPPLPFEPSDDLETLTQQLLAALPGSTRAGLDSWLRYFDAIIAVTTLAVANGQLDVPGEQHARMHVFLPFIEDHHGGRAAAALHGLIGMLEVQAHALRVPQIERIARDPTTLEHRVLRVLFVASPGQLDSTMIVLALTLDGKAQATPDEISAVLAQLLDLGLIVRANKSYRLWETGRDLCMRIGLT